MDVFKIILILFIKFFIIENISAESQFNGNYSSEPYNENSRIRLEIDDDRATIKFYQIQQLNTCYESISKKSAVLTFSENKALKSLNSGECPQNSFFDTCEISSSDFLYLGERKLICSIRNNQKQIILYSTNRNRLVGKSAVIGHVDGILVGGRNAVVKEAVKFREEPSILSKNITIIRKLESCCSKSEDEKFTSLQKDWNIVVIARTKEREKIEKWENYWYFVAVYESEFSQVYGWVFGQFIKIEGK
ncbi:hypothetical protein [Leptospira hartskeerlii]|nr:hypothetical protein [Leptospira hartskeerlii]